MNAGIITDRNRKWPDGKIPFTFHEPIREVPWRVQFIKEAIQSIQEDSCLEFQDITGFMDSYMDPVGMNKRNPYSKDYFSSKEPPTEYPDYLYFTSSEGSGCTSKVGRMRGPQL